MKIHLPEIIYGQEAVRLQSTVEHSEGEGQLWFSVPSEWSKYLTNERCDAFVVGLLLYAMHKGEDIYVSGSISEKLYYNLTNYYMAILTATIPSLKTIKIIPEKIDGNVLDRMEPGVAAGFSGGIDSFCTIADHLYSPVPDGYRLTHFLFNNVGSHGKDGHSLFDERYKRLYPLTLEMGIPFIKVDSNLEEYIPFEFELTHTIRNISVVLSLQKLIKIFLYASGYRYQDCFVGKTYGMAYSDPFAVHLLSTETTECISSGSQYSRVQKTAKITEIPVTRKYLDVCTHSDAHGNCSECSKCARTLVTLEILGKINMYDQVFDLNKYYKNRKNFIRKILKSDNPLLKEIQELAKEKGIKYRFLAPSYYIKKFLCHHKKRVKK